MQLQVVPPMPGPCAAPCGCTLHPSCAPRGPLNTLLHTPGLHPTPCSCIWWALLMTDLLQVPPPTCSHAPCPSMSPASYPGAAPCCTTTAGGCSPHCGCFPCHASWPCDTPLTQPYATHPCVPCTTLWCHSPHHTAAAERFSPCCGHSSCHATCPCTTPPAQPGTTHRHVPCAIP